MGLFHQKNLKKRIVENVLNNFLTMRFNTSQYIFCIETTKSDTNTDINSVII